MDRHDREDEVEERAGERIDEIAEQENVDLDEDDRERLRDRARNHVEQLSASENRDVWRRVSRQQLSRRDFLKILGVTSLGAVAAAGLPLFARRAVKTWNTPTGMATADISEGDDISQAINSASGDIVIPGGTQSSPKTYEMSEPLQVSGRVLADGCVQCKVPGGMDKRGRIMLRVDGGEIGGAESGGHWIIDQSAENCVALSRVSNGNLGNANGTITFSGNADVIGSEWTTAAGYANMVRVSGDCTIRNAYWPDGNVLTYDGPRSCAKGDKMGNIVFNWHGSGGTIRYIGCFIRGFPNNCFYYKPATGKLVVDQCYLAHNTNAHIRTGCRTIAKNSVLKTGKVISKYAGWRLAGSSGCNPGDGQHAIRCQGKGQASATIDIQNCEFWDVGEDDISTHIREFKNSTSFTINIENSRATNPDDIVNQGNLTINGSFDPNPEQPEPPSICCGESSTMD